ncbi:hypothetical protein TGAM01_v201726 [Trichoderma gamsii]|uniref:UBL3-like ubiquitin domain-containing protein n=1 Tax=Trichoderma gamsii TaxID=398673 RepID=A0A0W7VMV1_9HYPO|nr:hypothetical protein TGAM01_v201726 [Trichoderma gamsii]PNP45842.1 hypothetical protein TGAMA5MH_02582 [Trichoderma gamsii]PON29477.1 hypothetical protein TGAM01_v201726 [Trichoderma gamsii]
MSAPADSTMSGGSAAPGNDSGLDQPTDAVLMKNIPQTPEAGDKPSDEATTDAAKDTPAVATTSADPVSTDDGETTAPTSSSKGKEVASAPEPITTPKGDVTQQDTPKQDAPKDESSIEEKPKEEKSKEDKQGESAMAIGPAEEEIKATGSGGADGPVCNITLLLASGGRHPYKIDAKYLSRRHVAMPDKDESGNPDPFSISIYTLKELILREWRSDWEAKPASPSSIRLIHFGKLLDDKEQLKKYHFLPDSPNVVHMSIRPQDLDEEEPKSGSKSLPSGATHGDGAREGRCCIIL